MTKLVIFDLGGVVATTPQFAIQSYAWQKGVPASLLQKLFIPTDENHPYWQLEIGKISLSQFYVAGNELMLKLSEEEGFKLHKDFSVEGLFCELYKSIKIVPEMLNASAALKAHGYRTCILSNNWADDTETRKHISNFLLIRHHFDEVFESCKYGLRKPDPEFYKLVCSRFNAQPNEVVLLDDLAVNLTTAKEMGITTILVKDPTSALATLQETTGIDVFEPHPVPACTASGVPHSIVQLKTGIMMHYVDVGQGPVLILLHGFPELWYIWKYQIPALACKGYRVIAPDLRGFGQTSSPQDLTEYSREKFASDVIALMDTLFLRQVTVVGHDWGGMVAWDLCRHYPDRIRAVANMTPFRPPSADVNPLLGLQAKPGRFQYQLYFMKEGPPEAELEKNLKRTFKLFYRGAKDMKSDPLNNTSNVLERGGLFVGLPEEVERSSMITEEDLDYFVDNYTKTGLKGPLNWYRSMEKDWRWNLKIVGRKVHQPALMITAAKDQVIIPELSNNMEASVPNLTRAHIEDSSHWTPLDCPLELNSILLDWLKKIYHGDSASKL